ncbi:transcription elongation factor GreA [Lacticaseibacillus pantheris]
MDYFDITPNGIHHLHTEIERLKAARPALIARVAAAAALGDRSENAEYTESKRELRHLESQMRYMDKQTRYGEVVTPVDDDEATLGKTVELLFDDDEEPETYQLVGPAEADFAPNNLTSASPLGQAILHHHVGDSCTVAAPNGEYVVKLVAVRLTPGML